MRNFALILSVVVGFWPFVAGAQAASPPCQFELGFKSLHDMIPSTVGACLEDENHNPANGDGLQHTIGGLLVWRKADNWTAFTDGYRTWINGPDGLVQRLNTQRCTWEGGTAPCDPTGTDVMTFGNVTFRYSRATWPNVAGYAIPGNSLNAPYIQIVFAKQGKPLPDGWPVITIPGEIVAGWITVYPADAYTRQFGRVPYAVQALIPVLANRPDVRSSCPLYFPSAPGSTLPSGICAYGDVTLPVFDSGAISDVLLKPTYLSFAGGSGLRLIVHYQQQRVVLDARSALTYTFQGLTDDQRYYVEADFNVTPTAPWPSGAPTRADGLIPLPTDMDPYNLRVASFLQSLPDSQYAPTLASLDSIVQSIRVTE